MRIKAIAYVRFPPLIDFRTLIKTVDKTMGTSSLSA